ncbi:MAG: transcriptional activator RfaH [Candidatus Hydrogenedens sp.]|nr:transcriptional activator RfaH [Candidatus Hydrogenedens sp.]
MKRWYAVFTQSHAETKAQFHLGRQGFDVYLPRTLKRRSHARRVDSIAAPLFPRYLFVGIDLAAMRWRSILSTIGVAGLICHGDQPVAVPRGVVEEIRARENAEGLVLLLPASPSFRAGDPIRVTDGAFKDHVGLFDVADDQRRVFILLDLLGRNVRVALSGDLVEAVV